MKSTGEKVGELIDALDNGFILYKDHNEEGFENREYLFKPGNMSYEMRGWGTAFGNFKDRILEIVKEPDNWKIFPNFNMNTDDYPFPWSSTWKEK